MNASDPQQVPYTRVRASSKSFEPSTERFDDRTTHNAAFQAHKVVPTVRGGPAVGGLPKEHIPFEGMSAYKSDFTKMPGNLSKGINLAFFSY